VAAASERAAARERGEEREPGAPRRACSMAMGRQHGGTRWAQLDEASRHKMCSHAMCRERIYSYESKPPNYFFRTSEPQGRAIPRARARADPARTARARPQPSMNLSRNGSVLSRDLTKQLDRYMSSSVSSESPARPPSPRPASSSSWPRRCCNALPAWLSCRRAREDDHVACCKPAKTGEAENSISTGTEASVQSEMCCLRDQNSRNRDSTYSLKNGTIC